MAEPSLEIPELRARAVADGMPRWLAEVLAKHGLEPHDGWPPAHHRLTERDLPFEEDEDDMLHTTQVRVVQELCAGLEMRYEARDDVLIAQELLVYFDGERPSRASARRVSPDLLVAFGMGKPRARASFTVWEEGRAPDFVLEILSEATWKRDVGEKVGLYEAMGVREYFLFDPHGRAEPRLQGWAYRDLSGGTARHPRRTRRRLPSVPLPAGMRGIHSEALGLTLCHTAPWPDVDYGLPGAGKVRWFDPATGRLLETYPEAQSRMLETHAEAQRRLLEEARAAKERLRAAETRARAATERADALAAELAKLEAQSRD